MLCSKTIFVWSGSSGITKFRMLHSPSPSFCLHLLRSASARITTAAVRFSSSITTPELEAQKTEDGCHITPFSIFDTAKGQKCRLTTRRPNILTWYSCGPTVYDSAHIGHASSFIRQDLIRRILEGMDKEVTLIQIMGITDVDDKIIKKANESGVEWSSVSRNFEREFLEDLQSLNILPPHVFTRVSNHIPQILEFVGKLVKMGLAYEVPDGSVYFDTEKYGSEYGVFRQVLSSDDTNPQEESSTSSDGKRNPKDFALWKGAKPEEPFWTSPWGKVGKGRPGWHIECSVMASQYFGPTLDLHTGGRDLIFPHHENEEAQCRAHFQSSQWTSHWLHMGHLHFKGDVKMSKSLGNTVSIRAFLKEYSPDVLRVICIMSRYRKNIEYSKDTLETGQKILKKLHTFLSDTDAILNGTKPVRTSKDENDNLLWKNLKSSKCQLNASLLDDFDTPQALKIVTELISDFNRHYIPYDTTKEDNFSPVDFQLVLAIKTFVQDFLKIVGLSSSSSLAARTNDSSSLQADSLRLENILNQFIQFRNQVRSYSLAMEVTSKDSRKEKISERKDLLIACDKVRDEMLRENQVEIKDYGKNSSWSFAEPKIK